jgi:thymidylate synthase (FAD)
MNTTIVEQSVKLLWITPDPAKTIERAGRVCYKSEDKITEDSAKKFVETICACGHDSVIEHASASFLLTTDRGITHEIVRHRVGCSYSQESTRYVNYNKKQGLCVIAPLGLTEGQYAVWSRAMEEAAAAYESLLDDGCKPQAARDVLPTCTKADIVTTATFRAWKHFIKLRTSNAAHPKIRRLAGGVQQILQRECPAVFGVEDPTGCRV